MVGLRIKTKYHLIEIKTDAVWKKELQVKVLWHSVLIFYNSLVASILFDNDLTSEIIWTYFLKKKQGSKYFCTGSNVLFFFKNEYILLNFLQRRKSHMVWLRKIISQKLFK